MAGRRLDVLVIVIDRRSLREIDQDSASSELLTRVISGVLHFMRRHTSKARPGPSLRPHDLEWHEHLPRWWDVEPDATVTLICLRDSRELRSGPSVTTPSEPIGS